MSTTSTDADILTNIANNLLPVQKLITGAAYVLAIAFVIKGLHLLKSYGESRAGMSGHSSMKEPMLYLFVATMFIYFPTGVAMLLQTSFGSPNILSYGSASYNNIGAIFGIDSTYGRAITIIVQTIGLAAFVRGWVLIAKSSAQGQTQGGTGKGLVHVCGGILAINIVSTVQMINNTIYGTT